MDSDNRTRFKVKLRLRNAFVLQKIGCFDSTMRNLLLTGFEPFDGSSLNPSAEIAKALNGKKVGNRKIVGEVLPLDYSKLSDIIDKLLAKHSPDIILCCGQANRASISIERIAVNAVGTRRADNYDYIPESDIIDPQAPAGYFSNIDIQPLIDALVSKGIPAYISYHAGTYGCNWLIFQVLHRIYSGELDAHATFVHLPPLPNQAIERDQMSIATMPFEVTSKAVKTIIKAIQTWLKLHESG